MVSGETDTADNVLTDGKVTVVMKGDIAGPEGVPDGKVDMYDIGTAAKAFGSYPRHPRWNPAADVTGPEDPPDNTVDMRDIENNCQRIRKNRPVNIHISPPPFCIRIMF